MPFCDGWCRPVPMGGHWGAMPPQNEFVPPQNWNKIILYEKFFAYIFVKLANFLRVSTYFIEKSTEKNFSRLRREFLH